MKHPHSGTVFVVAGYDHNDDDDDDDNDTDDVLTTATCISSNKN